MGILQVDVAGWEDALLADKNRLMRDPSNALQVIHFH